MEKIHNKTRVAILASGDPESGGGGSTMARFIEGTQQGEIDAEVAFVVCNNPREKVGVYDHVDRLNAQYGTRIPVLKINGITHPGGKNERGQTNDESAAICEQLSLHGVSTVLLLGYMKQLNGQLVEDYGWKPEFAVISPENQGMYQAHIINTHPGILPQTADTHGIGASERAIELGLSHTAHTLHVVGDGIDTGPTIAEHLVKIETTDAQTLFDSVQIMEKRMICSAIDGFLKDQAAFQKTNPHLF